MNDPTGMTAGQLLRRMESGEISALEVVRAHLSQIDALDPELHSFVRVNPRAEEEAVLADVRRSRGDAGVLNGVPVALKDNLDALGLETTCASRLLQGYVPTRDATAVARLRAAGAVFLGKTNLDEFAMGSSTENSAYGATRNPWGLDRVPGGSSGGSAVAVAARMAPLALGSDTGGSIRQPSALCGVVGLKPTYGRVSRSGLVAFGSSLDQIGPLTRDVADAARVLAVVAGVDPRDQTSSTRVVGDYLAACDSDVRGLSIGLPREYFDHGLDPEIADAVRGAADLLEREGGNVEEVSLPHTRYSIPTYYLVATAEASSNLARYDGVRYGRRANAPAEPEGAEALSAMVRRTRGQGFGVEVKRRIMLGTYALARGYHDQFYGTAQRARTLVRRDFLDLFEAGVDLLLTPTTPTPAFRLGEKMEDPLKMYLSDAYTTTANLAGLPALAVPVGRTRSGLPIGAQLIAPDFGEERLFRAGATLGRLFPTEVPPWVTENSPGGRPEEGV